MTLTFSYSIKDLRNFFDLKYFDSIYLGVNFNVSFYTVHWDPYWAALNDSASLAWRLVDQGMGSCYVNRFTA